MQGTVVGVLRGGASRKHDASLHTGHAILNALPRERYTVRDIYIDRENVWHERGLRTSPANVLPMLDVAVITLHGDGQIYRLLEQYGVPHTGSDFFAAFEAGHKVISKEKARAAGVNVSRYSFIEQESDVDPAIHEIIRTYPQPVIVRSPRSGSRVGTTAPAGYQPVHQAVTGLLKEEAGGALVEEYVRGAKASVVIVEDLRGEELYALPVVETVPAVNDSTLSQAVAPGRFNKVDAVALEAAARAMHRTLGLRHYSRSNFIVSPRGVFYTGTSSIPTLDEQSATSAALASVGISPAEFVEHLIGLALGRGKR